MYSDKNNISPVLQYNLKYFSFKKKQYWDLRDVIPWVEYLHSIKANLGLILSIVYSPKTTSTDS